MSATNDTLGNLTQLLANPQPDSRDWAGQVSNAILRHAHSVTSEFGVSLDVATTFVDEAFKIAKGFIGTPERTQARLVLESGKSTFESALGRLRDQGNGAYPADQVATPLAEEVFLNELESVRQVAMRAHESIFRADREAAVNGVWEAEPNVPGSALQGEVAGRTDARAQEGAPSVSIPPQPKAPAGQKITPPPFGRS